MVDSSPEPSATTEMDDRWQETVCLSTSVRRVDRALSRIYDEMLRPSGLTVTQYSILSILGRAPSRLSLSQLAEAQVMDRTTLSRNLIPLERMGFLRIDSGSDRRTRFVTVTEEGRRVVERARPLWQVAQDRVAAAAGHERLEYLLDELSRLTARIHEDSSR